MLQEIIKKRLLEIAQDHSSGKLTDDDVMKELNSAVFYKIAHQSYIYEFFFMVALENNIKIRSPFLLSMLFKYIDYEDVLETEDCVSSGTRKKYLKFLGLDETFKKYHDYVVDNDPDPHHHEQKYFKKKITLENVRDSILEELK